MPRPRAVPQRAEPRRALRQRIARRRAELGLVLLPRKPRQPVELGPVPPQREEPEPVLPLAAQERVLPRLVERGLVLRLAEPRIRRRRLARLPPYLRRSSRLFA